MRGVSWDESTMATFELWNSESGNLVGSFATEAMALAAIREAIRRNGEGYGELLVLGSEDSRGNSKVIASGRQLVDRVVDRDVRHVNHEPRIGSGARERRRSG
jgi:hypothetical protein